MKISIIKFKIVKTEHMLVRPFSVLHKICFVKPKQAKRPVQQSPRLFPLDSDIAAVWIYLQLLSLDIWHTDTLACTHCQTRALVPHLSPSLLCTGQWNRVQERPWLLFVLFSPSGISKGQHNLCRESRG